MQVTLLIVGLVIISSAIQDRYISLTNKQYINIYLDLDYCIYRG